MCEDTQVASSVNLLDTLFAITDFPSDRLDVVLVIGPEAAPDIGDVVLERFGPDVVRLVSTSEPVLSLSAHEHRRSCKFSRRGGPPQ